VTSSLRLAKLHGLGNDFLVVLDEVAGERLVVDGDLARRLCDRRTGIGADGLIHGAFPDARQRVDGTDVVMHLFNADGSRAEISGNGIRCLGQAVARHRGMRAGAIMAVTDAGRRRLVCEAGADERTMLVSVGMGHPAAGPDVPVPVDEALAARHATVDMGNPHLVIEVDDPAGVDLASEGAWFERQFADGVNVEFIAMDRRDRVQLRVWERGAGITEACGSGACAAVHVAHAWGAVDDRVVVAMPGGEVVVRIEGDGTVTLEGPSVHVADIEVPWSTDPVPVGAPISVEA